MWHIRFCENCHCEAKKLYCFGRKSDNFFLFVLFGTLVLCMNNSPQKADDILV
jgi:hypothetical protein